MNNFECQCICNHQSCFCLHNKPTTVCNCIRQISRSTKFIERLLDCTEVIVRVLSICGIHECKAKAASDVIMFGFLHFKIVPDPVNDVLRRRLRKEEMFYDLGVKSRMHRIEACLAYSIIKKAFKAFYYKQTADNYKLDFVDETQWMRAAEKTAEDYASLEDLRENEKKKLENRIKTVYGSFIRRVKEVNEEEKKKSCTCCFCNNSQMYGRGCKLYANVLPKDDEAAYRFKKRLIEEGRKAAKDPDPCGHRILEWQTRIKTSIVTEPCAIVDDDYISDPLFHCSCTCKQIPCICIANTEILHEKNTEPVENPEGEE